MERNIAIAIILIVLFVVLGLVGFAIWWMHKDVVDYKLRRGKYSDLESSRSSGSSSGR
ncbi:hypothetical protein ANO11243_078290 [Dothideomycetidae sp. 11243]|nr:hypothetical protein ANO11243_078290 [fungal sp. No.11243]